MSQQINLINTSLIKKKDFLTSANIALSYGLLTLVMMAWYSQNKTQLADVQHQRDQLAAHLEQAQNQLTQANAARAPKAVDQGLLQTLAALEGKHQMQTQLLSTIERGLNDSGNGLSAYLRGFAKQNVDGLWLSGIRIDNDRHAMTLRGRSLQADLLPLYIERLSQERVFAGHEFGGLQIKRPLDNATKATNAMPVAVNAATNAGVPPAQNLAQTANQTVNTPIETVQQAALAPYIEFELKALEVAKTETTPQPAMGASAL